MTDRWMDRLSEYVDGELGARDASALEDHLNDCAECRAALDELRAVVKRAAALHDREPTVDLWPGIADGLPGRVQVTPIAGRRRFRDWRVSASIPQLAAAGLALLLISSGILLVALDGDEAGTSVPVAAPVSAPAVPASPVAAYGGAIEDLERVLQEARGSLDTATVRVIEESLGAIDRAIAEAEAALAEDPASRYLHEHLNLTMQRKLALLNQAAALATASS